MNIQQPICIDKIMVILCQQDNKEDVKKQD